MNDSELRRDPRKNNPINRPVMLGVIVLVALGLGACSSGSQSGLNASRAERKSNPPGATPAAANSKTEKAPAVLMDAGEYGENIYDFAKANDWKKADAKLAALKEATKKVRAEVKNQSKNIDGLDADVAALDRAVTAKDRPATMTAANQITRDVAGMTAAYKVSVPVEVVLLDYYGRELEIWAEAKDAGKLQATAREMRKTWNAVRPSIEAKNPAVAKKFEGLVAQVEAAKAPADYAKVAKPVLDEVDNLEKVFE
ncbi:MAG: hypothetical protein QOE96_2372 [Blastocatellia bacterium]|jgi:hypothetical protein|nr:hypothetical protein [Blastocatellia bacterium]